MCVLHQLRFLKSTSAGIFICPAWSSPVSSVQGVTHWACCPSPEKLDTIFAQGIVPTVLLAFLVTHTLFAEYVTYFIDWDNLGTLKSLLTCSTVEVQAAVVPITVRYTEWQEVWSAVHSQMPKQARQQGMTGKVQ